ncbi:hypothetical protein [Corynebacterium renale]|uniref:Uncharacterized protein n=1 Tax=Corynebacterium renale TaxID=1724 RepID=A0A2A9DNW3_9CORY|nr:hypothetical protein [Corynebacterium renale]PFG27599.1 hypothetical protein ATK06_0670 [Corynebacterium renale]SQI22982.1 Uncharacterised protein [Corynebacterium renale]
MSTTIQVYPSISDFPFVEQTRARTEELFQELLDRYRVGSTIEVKAFYPAKSAEDEIRYVDKHVAWAPDMEVGFSYWINGEWDSSSWPSCLPVDDADRISEEDLVYPFHSKPEHLGQWAIVEEFEGVLPPEKLSKILAQDHYWSEYRNFAGPAIASIGYGLVAAALAEATDGVIASIDSAFEIEHNGESAAEFLAWWGDEQIAFYGTDDFKGVGGI